MQSELRKRIIPHLLLGVFFVFTPLFMVFVLQDWEGHFRTDNIVRVVSISTAMMITTFYLNYGILFPKLFLRRKYSIYLLSLFTIFILSILFVKISFAAGRNDMMTINDHSSFILLGVFRIGLSIIGSSVLVIYERWQEAELSRIRTENAFLRAQINPHFLFNTLNSLYALALNNSDKTAGAIEKLSAAMRYITVNSNRKSVPLADELEYIASYVELQKLRLTATTNVEFIVSGDPTEMEIEPLILITFVENAFKYGVSTESSGTIKIEAKCAREKLNFLVQNPIRGKDKIRSQNATGLRNVSQRLSISYSGKHNLEYKEVNDFFIVKLEINFK